MKLVSAGAECPTAMPNNPAAFMMNESDRISDFGCYEAAGS